MIDWEHRQLCPDGSCIGLIGHDGTCKTCGRAAPNWGDERTRGMVAPEDEEDDPDDGTDDDGDGDELDGDDGDSDDDGGDEDGDEDGDDEGDEDGRHSATDVGGGDAPRPRVATDDGEDWGQRALCPDGGCVGVLGADGHCRTCGRSAA